MSEPVESIGDDEIVLRHIPGGETYQVPPTSRISSGNFDLKLGEQGASVSWSVRKTPTDLVQAMDGDETSRVAAARVGDIRAMGLDVIHDPQPDDPAHCLIIDQTATLKNRKTRQKLAATVFSYLPEYRP